MLTGFFIGYRCYVEVSISFYFVLKDSFSISIANPKANLGLCVTLQRSLTEPTSCGDVITAVALVSVVVQLSNLTLRFTASRLCTTSLIQHIFPPRIMIV